MMDPKHKAEKAAEKSALDRVVDRVMAGEYGVHQARYSKLRAEGHNPFEVQAAVNKTLGVRATPASGLIPDYNQMAKDAKAGKYGPVRGLKKVLGDHFEPVKAIMDGLGDDE